MLFVAVTEVSSIFVLWLGLQLTIRGFVIVTTITEVSSILISCYQSEFDFNQLSPK